MRKCFYLEIYVVGEPHKAVEGFLYCNTENAYNGAWTVFEDRYGNPFTVQRAFRERLVKWPRVAANDPRALREFTDFLLGCSGAVPHVKACLSSMENHKILNKMSVFGELDQFGKYPSVLNFNKFMHKEIRQPELFVIPSLPPFLLMMNMKPTNKRSTKRGKTLNTSTRIKAFDSATLYSKPKSPGLGCRNEAQGVTKCSLFVTKSMDEHCFCFGCLQKGHITKYCRSACAGHQPTYLHRENKTRRCD